MTFVIFHASNAEQQGLIDPGLTVAKRAQVALARFAADKAPELAFYPIQRGRIERGITLIEIKDTHRRAATLKHEGSAAKRGASEDRAMTEYCLRAVAAGLAR